MFKARPMGNRTNKNKAYFSYVVFNYFWYRLNVIFSWNVKNFYTRLQGYKLHIELRFSEPKLLLHSLLTLIFDQTQLMQDIPVVTHT